MTNLLTIKELKHILSSYPDENEYGEPYYIWVDNGDGTSSEATNALKLNVNDIIIMKR